jgi:hypothetical protein
MGRLFDLINHHVERGEYIVGNHASERLDERGLLEWQAVSGLRHGIPDRGTA